MHQIKFRAWDKNGENWYYYDLAKLVNGIRDTLAHVTQGDRRVNKYEHVTLSTGLKDKNGKEIYEGEVYLRKGMIEIEGVGEKHEEEQAVVRNFIEDVWHLHQFIRNGFKVEVIGNIYENPELLDGAQPQHQPQS